MDGISIILFPTNVTPFHSQYEIQIGWLIGLRDSSCIKQTTSWNVVHGRFEQCCFSHNVHSFFIMSNNVEHTSSIQTLLTGCLPSPPDELTLLNHINSEDKLTKCLQLSFYQQAKVFGNSGQTPFYHHDGKSVRKGGITLAKSA